MICLEPVSLVGLHATVKYRSYSFACLILDETEKTIVVQAEGQSRPKRLPKQDVSLILKEGAVMGSSLLGKPWKRIKRRR